MYVVICPLHKLCVQSINEDCVITVLNYMHYLWMNFKTKINSFKINFLDIIHHPNLIKKTMFWRLQNVVFLIKAGQWIMSKEFPIFTLHHHHKRSNFINQCFIKNVKSLWK
jgi:hypothetical protein